MYIYIYIYIYIKTKKLNKGQINNSKAMLQAWTMERKKRGQFAQAAKRTRQTEMV